MRLCQRFLLILCLLVWSAATFAEDVLPLPDEVKINGVEFVRVPPGDFWYIVSVGRASQPRRLGLSAYREIRVWLDEYYIAKYEARAKDFVRFMNSPAVRSDWIGDPQYWFPEDVGCAVLYKPGAGYRERYPDMDLPATAVSWDLANDFSRWMGFRLPTEAEWQKAARGTDRRIWPWGDEYPDETYANFGLIADCAPAPVTAYPKGKSPYGVYNMAGNVAEWTANWFNHDFDDGLVDGVRDPSPPTAPERSDAAYVGKRIAKGERWGAPAGSISIAMRTVLFSGKSSSSSGLRFAIDASDVRAKLLAGTAEPVAETRR